MHRHILAARPGIALCRPTTVGIYQGRDEKGRFGHGTSPYSDDTGAGSVGADAGGDPLSGIKAVVYGVVGHLSPTERRNYTAHLDQGGLSKLSESLLAWSKASSLDRDTFRERFLGGNGSDEAVDHLRNAALRAARATTTDEQRDAAGELAGAYRSVGAKKFGERAFRNPKGIEQLEVHSKPEA